MEYWPWWAAGLALSAVMVFHWLALHRMMAVSGRVTALIDRLRHGSTEPEAPMSAEEILAAIQAATAAEFGAMSPDSDPSPSAAQKEENAAEMLAPTRPRTPAEHGLFFLGLVCGGGLAAMLGGGFTPTLVLTSGNFAQLSGGTQLVSWLLLAVGGVLVGFGTRMSGGCTSGHGLCGTSRLQPGSLLATMSFFGVGILVSFAIEALL